MFSNRSDRRLPHPAGFRDNASHLRAEIGWVRQLVSSEIRAATETGDEASIDEFAGLCISREEIERYLRQPPAAPRDDAFDAVRRPFDDDVSAARARVDALARQAVDDGVDLRFERLARAFELDGEARLAVVCAVAAELDPQVSRMFAYLQNDAMKRRPTCGVLAGLITRRAADPVSVWQLFGPASPLVVDRLLDGQDGMLEGALPAREARPAPGVVEFLLGIDALPSALAAVAELVPSFDAIDDLAYYRHHRAVVEELLRCRRAAGRLPLCYVAGPAGAEHRVVASLLAGALDKQVLAVSWPRLRAAGGSLDDAGRLAGREARLRNCLVLLEGADEPAAEADGDRSRPKALQALVNALADADVVAAGVIPAAELRHRAGVHALGFELPYPSPSERLEIWRHHLPAGTAAEDLALVSQKFKFTPRQIAHVARVAAMAAPRDDSDRPLFDGTDLHARCRAEAQRGLHLFCQKIDPRFDWADIVLPLDTQSQLQEICRWVKYRSRVYESWGFGGKLAVGRGVTVLFSGASGTGKTMSAEIIARDLQLDLFRVDLSRIVSKYIGETEKNLSRIFEESAIGNCVLFFDEADALFGKRTEVKDAHDRYANIEVNYLLSEMDRCEGIVIISTNVKGNLDSAFLRRFTHVVEYPVPDERLRQSIWCKAFPERMPRGADVDFAFLAQRFTLAGGNIKNIALASAFLAAADAKVVGMEHVIRATKREYQKLGRVCSKSDFGQYYGLVREAELS
jgi:SpoVK/Ycf46/Vps4 family AAA+-type ATPase